VSLVETLKALILEAQEAVRDTGVPRRLQVEAVPGKAAVVIGVRRAGKSTYLWQIVEKLLKAGVARENVLYLNFFDDRLHGLRHDNLELIAEAYFGLFPDKHGSEKVYVFLDEIQMVPGWEAFVDRLLRTETCEVYLTGSSARMLSREVAGQMRGRALSWERFPFSFREHLDSRGIDPDRPLSTHRRLTVAKAFQEYWEDGGFPEVVGLVPDLRIKILQEYFHAILFRDLIERHDISHPRALVDLAYWLVDNVASLYSLNGLTGYLKSLGHKAHKASVADYLAWIEDAYFFFTVRLFDASLSRSNSNPKKVYAIDHALVSAVSSGILVNSGHLLENLVFTQLRRQYQAIYYYRTHTGKEVDFIVSDRNRPRRLVQVCYTLADPRTRQREIAALLEAMAELGLRESSLVTWGEADEVRDGERAIDVIPAWKFLIA